MKAFFFALIPIAVIFGLIVGGVVQVPGMGPPAKRHSKSKKKVDASTDATNDASKDTPPDAPKDTNKDLTATTSPSTPADPTKASDTAKRVDAAQTTDATSEADGAKGLQSELDPKKGALKLATVWNDMDAAKLYAIVDKWNDEDLAKVLAVMDTDKVVELLSKMNPDRASALSKEIQHLGSIVSDNTSKT